VTEIRVNVVPGQVRRERVGRFVVTEAEFDLVPLESARESIEFETVAVRPMVAGSQRGEPRQARQYSPEADPDASLRPRTARVGIGSIFRGLIRWFRSGRD
jgi:hypothetical protein